jgi:hypothetical protein
MILKDMVQSSIFATDITALSEHDVLKFNAYFNFKKPLINLFPFAIFSINGESQFINSIHDYIKKNISTNFQVVVSPNLGHTFGSFLLDYKIFEISNNLNYNYIWKFANDVIVDTPILEYSVPDADFYYINNIGYISLDKINEPERPKYSKDSLAQAAIDQTYFYPQTNYYIIKNNIDFYPDIETIYKLKQEYDIIKQQNPHIQPWHAIYECDSENMLKKTIINNDLKIYYLLDMKDTKSVIDYVDETKNYDGSHKNVLYSQLGNLCHLHYPQSPVYVI